MSLVSAQEVGAMLSRHRIQSEIGLHGPNYKIVSYKIKVNTSGLEPTKQYNVIRSFDVIQYVISEQINMWG